MFNQICKISILTLFMLVCKDALAQDTIVKRDGSELQTRVLEVGTTEIKYKKFENLGGTTYTIKKTDVFMIKYENGTKDVFDSEKSTVTNRTNTQPIKQPVGRSGDVLPNSSLNINALGLIQFGPILQYETKLKDRLYLAPHFRYAYAGVLTHLVWTGFDGELSAGTAAIGVGIKSFAEEVGNTWYYGGMLDYQWGTASYDVGELSESEEVGRTLAILSNVGYRWRSSKATYLNLGLFAGIAPDLKAEETFFNSGEVEDNRQTTFFAMVELSFGWEY